MCRTPSFWCHMWLAVEYRRHGTRPPGCSLPRSNPLSVAEVRRFTAISGRLLFQIFAQTRKIHFRQYFSWKKKDASICRRWHSNMIITGHLNTDFTGHDTNPHRLLEEKICSGWDEKLVSMAKTIKDAHELHRVCAKILWSYKQRFGRQMKRSEVLGWPPNPLKQRWSLFMAEKITVHS